jgi:DNA polymerase-3 subunit alpha
VDLRAVNRSTIEALVKCGAFDTLGASRAAMMAALDEAISIGQAAAKQRKSGQMSFFGSVMEAPPTAPRFPEVEPWSETQLLQAEKETLGFYITSHPLVKYGREIEALAQPGNMTLARLEQLGHGTRLALGCMISQVRPTFTKKDGKKMAMLTVEDLAGKCDAVVFPRSYDEYGHLLIPDAIVFIVGSLDRQRERPSILIDEILPVDEAVEKFTARLHLRLSGPSAKPERLDELRSLLQGHPGNIPMFLHVRPGSRPDVLTVVRPGSQWQVRVDRDLLSELEAFFTDQQPIRLEPHKLAAGNGRKRFYRRDSSPQGQKGEVSAAVSRFN